MIIQPDKWDGRFLRLAREVSAWSKDPSTKVGAVLVSPDRSRIAVGYNGFARKMEDKPEWYADREEKYSRIIHAEKNAKANAGCSVIGWTQYTWPFASCDRCLNEMAQEGITRFVSPMMTAEIASRWEPIIARSRQAAADMNLPFLEVDFPTTYPTETA
jgi:dCMP deaminase